MIPKDATPRRHLKHPSNLTMTMCGRCTRRGDVMHVARSNCEHCTDAVTALLYAVPMDPPRSGDKGPR